MLGLTNGRKEVNLEILTKIFTVFQGQELVYLMSLWSLEKTELFSGSLEFILNSVILSSYSHNNIFYSKICFSNIEQSSQQENFIYTNVENIIFTSWKSFFSAGLFFWSTVSVKLAFILRKFPVCNLQASLGTKYASLVMRWTV